MTPASAQAERPRQYRIRRATARWVPALTLLGVAALVVKSFVLPDGEVDCAKASRSMTPGNAVLVCQREYQRTRRPLSGIYLADVLRRSDNPAEAAGIAKELLSTDLRGDAQQILAKIAKDQNRIDDAIAAFQDARQWHRDHGNHAELARDDQALAELQIDTKQFATGLQLLDECVSESRAASDQLIEGYCHLSGAMGMMRAGDFTATQQELDRAEQLLSEDRDLARVAYWRGNLEQEVRKTRRNNHNALAVADFERAFELATRARASSLLLNLHMNLAFSRAEVGKFDAADHDLQEAGVLDSRGKYANQRAQLAARIAYRRGNLGLAFSINENLYPKVEDDDEKIEVSVVQARIALALHDLPAAVTWARRGVDAAEKIRAANPTGERRPWILASRREPLEVLFTALARAGKLDEAIAVFDRWQGSALFAEMVRSTPTPSAALSATAATIQQLVQWLPAVASSSLLASDGRAVTEALGKIDLVALAVAADEHEKGELWRLTANHGRFKLESLGGVDALQERLNQFRGTPTDRALADELGALLVPDSVARKTTEPLYVVLDAPLLGLPFVALRRSDQPLIAMRPVIRTPRLPTVSTCEPPAVAHDALVLADADGDLPAAREESSKVASLFGTTPLIGEAATSTALLGAKPVPLLHIAIHGDLEAGGGRLRLHDRAVSAPEIAASKLRPSLVVLSSCNTARASDPELAGSLSTAFLAAGAGQVIATLRRVSDLGSKELMTRFYDARGADDPVHVLAGVQAALAASNDRDWPYFAVFSNEVCTPRQ